MAGGKDKDGLFSIWHNESDFGDQENTYDDRFLAVSVDIGFPQLVSTEVSSGRVGEKQQGCGESLR